MKKSKNPKKTPSLKASPSLMAEPTREEVAAAAHSIWEQEGRPEGRAVEHWLKAEIQVRSRRDSQS
jgi:hypothetical protein